MTGRAGTPSVERSQVPAGGAHDTSHSVPRSSRGFGRIGKSLSALLLNFGVNLYVFDQKVNQVSTNINIVRTIDNLNKYQIIINTIPEIILNKNNLSTIQKDVLIIDVASYPGGIDKNNISGIKYIYASGLPGKKAPKTVAINMKKLMMDYIKMHCL